MPGDVKTRLIPKVGAGSAANIHARLATETLGDCIQVAEHNDAVQLELWCSPDPQHGFFQSFLGVAGMQLFTQQGEHLGERMASALCAESLPTVLIGTDCPPIDAAYINAAIAELADSSIVIGPAEDGGYGLIAMQEPAVHVFRDVPWSTDKVMEKTLQRCEELELTPKLMPTIWDVDEPEDLDRWLTSSPG